jgi:beta-lactam-binding protein with PASTA domain
VNARFALAAALGALAGVVLTLALGGGRSAHVDTITVPASPREDTRLAARVQVPPLTGLSLSAAEGRLRQAGLSVEVEGAGVVELALSRAWVVDQQYPPAGTVVLVGSAVQVIVLRR